LLTVALATGLTACDALSAAYTPAPTDMPFPTRVARVSTPTWTPTPTPTSTPIPPTTGPTASATPGCTQVARFIADVTIPDGTVIPPNTQFVKTWRIKNAGTCDWGLGYTLVFVGGDQLGGPSVVPVEPADAGVVRDVSVSLKAPASPGVYEGRWHLRDPQGRQLIGVTVSIVVPATPTPTPLPTMTPQPTVVPTYAGTLESFLGDWRIVEADFGGNNTDSQRLFKIVIGRSGSDLLVSPSTSPLSPYAFAQSHQLRVPYTGGREFRVEFDDSARGHVVLKMAINKACNATVILEYPGFRDRFLFWNVQPHISCT